MARARVSVAYYCREPGRATLESAREAALKAIDLDPGLSDAYVALAEVQRSLEWNWRLAEATYRKAIALAPSCEAAHRGLAVFLASMSRWAEAKAEADRACDLDPLCISVNTSAAWVSYAAGEFGEAIDRCRYTLDMDPTFIPARRMLGAAYLAAGQTERALAELEAAVGPEAGHPISLSWLAHAKAVAGSREGAMELTTRLESLGKESYVPAYHLALAHVGLGNSDRAFALLAKACDDRDPAIVNSIAVEPRFEPLRGDPRYTALMGNLGIER
jgi:tetratricopeptide (TPR) repeat protein